RLYDDVTDFVRDAYWSASGRMSWAARLTLVVLQREIGSSTFAAAETLRRLAQSPLFGQRERGQLEALERDARAIQQNVKATRLVEFLRSSDEKALVFTQYLRTLQHLQHVLDELDLILGNLDERRSFEDMMMEIWALRESEPRRAAQQRLGEALVRARTEYDRMQERNEEALRPVSEEVAA